MLYIQALSKCSFAITGFRSRALRAACLTPVCWRNLESPHPSLYKSACQSEDYFWALFCITNGYSCDPGSDTIHTKLAWNKSKSVESLQVPMTSGDSPGAGLAGAVPCATLTGHSFTKQTTKQMFYSGVGGWKSGRHGRVSPSAFQSMLLIQFLHKMGPVNTIFINHFYIAELCKTVISYKNNLPA